MGKKEKHSRRRRPEPPLAEENLEQDAPPVAVAVAPVVGAGDDAAEVGDDPTANGTNNDDDYYHNSNDVNGDGQGNDEGNDGPAATNDQGMMYPTEEDAGAQPMPPPSAAAAPSGPRTLTRAQALAQLRRGGPSALQGATISSKPPPARGAVDGDDESDHGAAVVPHDDGSSPTSNDPADPDSDEAEMEERAFSPREHEEATRAHRGGGRRRRSAKRRDEADGGAGVVYGTNAAYKDAAADDGIASHEDPGDGGEEASAPPGRGSTRRSVVTLPAETREGNAAPATTGANAAAAAPHAPEDPNSLPRMLRLQRAFETNMSKLYSFCATHVTEWPTLAVEWIPDRKFEDPERDYTLQYLATGTQTIKGAANQVRVMEIAVPNDTNADAMYDLYGDDDIGAPNPGEMDPEVEVDPGKLFKNVRGHFRCEQAITLDSTVLKIRAMPMETNILAVTTASGFIGVFNLVQDQVENEEGETVPDAILTGHSMGGFGLSWNLAKPGFIASGSDDGYVNYWDIKHRITIDLKEEQAYGGGVSTNGTAASPDQAGRECEPLQKLSGHRDIVTDVSWHATQGHLLTSASLDGDVRIWDIRTNSASITMHAAHVGGTTATQFHPVGAFQLATAGTGGELCFWDIRRTKEPLLELAYHGRAVTGLQWSPFNETVLASYGEDGRVVIWDLGKTSLPLEYSADALAPPEVSFVHIGHLGVVTDASWCTGKGDDWLMASADSFNGVHVYKPKESVVRDYVPRELW